MLKKIRWLRYLILAFGGLAPFLAGCSSFEWESNYEKGMIRAAQMNRRVLLEFYSPLNSDCNDMDRDVFSDSHVQNMMHEYVAIRLDTLLNKSMADQLNVQIVPTFFVLRPDGTIVGSYAGQMNEEKFRFFLIKHRYN